MKGLTLAALREKKGAPELSDAMLVAVGEPGGKERTYAATLGEIRAHLERGKK